MQEKCEQVNFLAPIARCRNSVFPISQAQAQAQVSDYICVPEFDLNIFSPHMGQLIFFWLPSFLAFLTFLRDRFFSNFYQNPSAVLCQTSTINALTGDTSTFTSLLFWSLGVNCRRLAQGHMWDLPEMEITW